MSDAEHLLMCLLAICMSSLEKCLFSFLANFFIVSFIFLELSCKSCLYIFEINYLSVALFTVIFSHSEGCLFTFLIVSFVVQQLLILIKIGRASCRERVWKKRPLLHCWWGCKLVQPLWRTVWRFLKKLEIELPYDPATPQLGIHTEEIGRASCRERV